mmetsp:Transcript_24945/g.27603  ORF Transcript_24945/g.27603 Transcript_24945/m.27603 type:complete len:81 (-) Transcript_24945:117-359(-)
MSYTSLKPDIADITKDFMELELEEDIEENPMVDIILSNILKILNKCFTSTNKSLFKSAIIQINSASDAYANSLNRHIPNI